MRQSKPQQGISLNRGHPLAQGLVGAWFAYEGAGETLHDLARGNDGALQGGVTWAAGRDGPVLNCDGTTDSSVELPDMDIDTFSLFSTALIHAGNSGTGCFPGRHNESSSVPKWTAVLRISGTTLQGGIGDGNNFIYNSDVATLNTGQWYSLAMTWDHATLRFFLDGAYLPAEDAFKASFGVPRVTSNIWDYLGYRNGSAIDGESSIALIYNRALPASQIRQLHADPYVLIRSQRRWWPMVEAVSVPLFMHQYRRRRVSG